MSVKETSFNKKLAREEADKADDYFDILGSTVRYENLPTDLDAAIERIKFLEIALEDLSRASEIAQYSGQFELLGSFRNTAEELLRTKIRPAEADPTEMNITIIS